MPHVVFLNHVNNDGTGDYSHAVDVINAIKKLPEMKDCTFSTVISCGKDQAARIRARLGEIESDDNAVFFGVDSDPENKLYEKPEVIASLEKADQVFIISFALNDMPEYDKHFKPQAPKKFIGEHESSNDAFDSLANFKWQDCSMGFGINAHKQTRSGIKLTQTRKQSPKSALESIEKEDKSGFVAALLENTNSATIDDFCSSNHLIPAYFNTRGLDKFFLFLASNPELSDNKNVSLPVRQQ